VGPRGVGRYARTDYDDLVSWARWMKGFRLMSTGARGKPAQQRACPVWGRDEDLVGKQLCVGNSRGTLGIETATVVRFALSPASCQSPSWRLRPYHNPIPICCP